MKSNAKAVYRLAVSDKKFLKVLLKDPEKACATAQPEKLELPAEEMKLLKKVLNKKTSLTTGEILGYVSTIVSTAAAGVVKKPWPPPPPWWPDMPAKPDKKVVKEQK
jgi:hypothetical protein